MIGLGHRNYQKIAEEVKSDYESQLMEVNYRSKQEIQRLKTESKRNLAERMAKVTNFRQQLVSGYSISLYFRPGSVP